MMKMTPRRWLLFGAIAVLGMAAILVYVRLGFRLDVDTLGELIRSYGYATIFVLTVAGSLGLPLPEETLVILAGTSAAAGYMPYENVVLVCFVSAVTGDNLGYLLGRRGGRPLVLKLARVGRISMERVDRLASSFRRNGRTIVFFARFVGGLRFLSGPLAGTVEMPYPRFVVFNALGAATWVIVITQLGYHYGTRILLLIEQWHRVGLWILGGVATVGGLWWLARGRRARVRA